MKSPEQLAAAMRVEMRNQAAVIDQLRKEAEQHSTAERAWGAELERLRARLDESDLLVLRMEAERDEARAELEAMGQRAHDVLAGRVDDFVLGDGEQAELVVDIARHVLGERASK